MIVYIINTIVINHVAIASLILIDKFLNFNKPFFILFVLGVTLSTSLSILLSNK